MTQEIINALNEQQDSIDAHLENEAHAETLATASDVIASNENEEDIKLNLPDIAALYHAVRPVLQFAKTVLGLFKPKWRDAINTFVAALDALYPQD
jgi:hypothetical protein